MVVYSDRPCEPVCTKGRNSYSVLTLLGNEQEGVLRLTVYPLCPTDNADPPTSPQMRPLPPKREAENIHAVIHILLFYFFPPPQESSQVSTSQTQGSSNSTNSSQSMSGEAFCPPNTASSQFVELPELGSRSKSSPN